MHSALEITLLNTVFWTALHFGTAELVTHLPLDVQHRLFDWPPPPAPPLEGPFTPVQPGV